MSSSNSNSNTNIIPKSCTYGCNTRIYWNNEENAYFEVFSKKKYVCDNSTTTTNLLYLFFVNQNYLIV